MAKKKLTLTVEENIVETIKGADRGASYWIEQAVEYHLRRGQAAFELLTGLGWRGRELLAVANACMGWFRMQQESGPALAMEMADWARLNEGEFGQWHVERERWERLVGRVAEAHHSEVQALFVVVDEVWLGLGDMERRLRRDLGGE
jgi:hypothetical protein